jgi:hypothetical protein
MNMSLCSQCGAPAEVGFMFCKNCGATLQPPVSLIQSHEHTVTSNVKGTMERKAREEMVVKRNAGWFLFVALISLINSILYGFDVHVEFFLRLWGGLGLAVTELVSVFARRSGGVGFVLALIINGFISGLFLVFWNFARKGNKWAFWAGAGLYALDGLSILLFLRPPLVDLAFHAVALFFMLGGAYAISRLQRLEQTG